MTTWLERARRPITRIEAACWTVACLSVSAVYAVGATLALQMPEEKAGLSAAAPAIMIELAPEPEAEVVDKTEITEDRVDAEERVAEKQPAPVKLPEPEPEPEPAPVVEKAEIAPPPVQPPPAPEPVQAKPPEPLPPDVRSVLPKQAEPILPSLPAAVALPQPAKVPDGAVEDPLESRMMAALETMSLPVPLARPEPKPVQRETVTKRQPDEKAAARPKQKAAPSVAARKAAVEAKQSERTAARETTASIPSAGKAVTQSWKARVVAHLERRKRYPAAARSRNEQGTVVVAFRIDGGGRVLSTSLSRSSGSAVLDDAAVAMVQRASPVPAPPPGAGMTLTVPVLFRR